MACNFRLKKYANGSVQLTYYDKPVLDSYDRQLLKFQYRDNSQYIQDTYMYDIDSESPFGDIYDVLDDNMRSKNIEYTEEELLVRKEHSLRTSLNRTIKKIYDYGRSNVWEWFLTFTLSEESVSSRMDYDLCVKKVSQWLKNIRKRYCKDMKYLLVPEMHQDGSWHFHALISNVNELTFEVAINNQPYRLDKHNNILLDKKGQPKRNKYYGQELRVSYPSGENIYNIKQYGNGWSTATKIQDTQKAVSYIVKYITKELTSATFGKKRYFVSRNIELPVEEKILESKKSLHDIVLEIERNNNVKLVAEHIKTINIKQHNYSNTISYLEFN